jgi:hypothetical protein
MTIITKEELLDLCEKFEKKYPLIKVFGFGINNIIVESKYTSETFTIPCWGLEALIEDNTTVYMTTKDKNV